MGKTGTENKKTAKAKRSPSLLDIAWAAGIFEGEGSVSPISRVKVAQKDKFLLYKLQDLFGGSIVLDNNRSVFAWRVCGRRARGFLYTVFTFLTPRRREQIRTALGSGEIALRQKLKRSYQ